MNIITITAGQITKNFTIMVDPVIEVIPVEDFELDLYDNSIVVGDMYRISPTVYPENATDTRYTYTSSNPQIASVSLSGMITGVSPGTATITVQLGTVFKQHTVTVKTSSNITIVLNETFITLKPSESFQLSAYAIPTDASQDMTYKSTDIKIATVSSSGAITGHNIGRVTIIISNGDISTSVTVIVNEIPTNRASDGLDNNAIYKTKLSLSEIDLIDKIESMTTTDIIIDGRQWPIISKSILKTLMQSDKKLIIRYTMYDIHLIGANIVNVDNPLYTQWDCLSDAEGCTFTIPEGYLPGTVVFVPKDTLGSETYMYLLDDETDQYLYISHNMNSSEYLVDIPGSYRVTKEKLGSDIPFAVALISFFIVFTVGASIYILSKNRYKFRHM